MAKKLNAAELFETIEVNLWGEGEYRVREATRKVEAQLTEMEAKLDKLGDDIDDLGKEAQFDVFADMASAILVPVEGQVQAKTVLKKLYKADVIGLSHVMELLDRLTEIRREQRPT